MSNVIKLRSDLKTFTIKVFYDDYAMEVERIELQKRKFGRLNGLDKVDLLSDIISLLEQEEANAIDEYTEDMEDEVNNPDFEKYAGRYGKSVKEWKTDRQKDLAKRKKAPKSPNAKVVRFRCKNK
tara:strand:- start:253 stop:627 length:375 start_codon:yes stop_codon:yes gene_type:complete